MKNKLIVFLFLLAVIGFFVHRFGIYDRYFSGRNQIISQPDSNIRAYSEPEGKNKIPKKKRPKKNNPFYKLEQYAFNTPQSKSRTIGELAAYLSKKGSNDYEKARLAYAWMAKNIGYDDGGYNAGTYGDLSAEGVLRSRKAVCEGFSNLYKVLCDSMGLECIKISGYAKGYGYTPGEKFIKTDHAWNAVKIDGQWKLVDVTWGEGYGKTVNGKLKSVKEYDPYWFATDPYEFLFKHLPENKKDQFIASPITKEQYELMPTPYKGLFQLGIPGETILTKTLNDHSPLPEAWALDYDISVLEAEMNHMLSSSQEYSFKVKCPENVDIAFINGKDWIHFEKSDGIYSGKITPKKGELTLSVRLNGFETKYSSILLYEVE